MVGGKSENKTNKMILKKNNNNKTKQKNHQNIVSRTKDKKLDRMDKLALEMLTE